MVDDELVVVEEDVVLGAEVDDGEVVELLVLFAVVMLLILSVSGMVCICNIHVFTYAYLFMLSNS